MLLGALRSALSAKVRDGELKVVQAFQFADHKTKQAMNALATLEAGRTVLVVDNGEQPQPGAGRAQPQGRDAIAHAGREPLSSAGAQERAAERSRGAEILGGAGQMNVYEVIRRPLVTEKGVEKKDTERTLVF